MNETWQKRVLAARRNGLQSHEIFVRLAQPGAPEALEILGVDTWSNPDGMGTIYGDPTFQQALYGTFASPPRSWMLRHPAGEWIEW
jgi:hypothetical protein